MINISKEQYEVLNTRGCITDRRSAADKPRPKWKAEKEGSLRCGRSGWSEAGLRVSRLEAVDRREDLLDES